MNMAIFLSSWPLYPFMLILVIGIGVEIAFVKRVRRKQNNVTLLKEQGTHTWGSLVDCRIKARMVDLTFVYQIEGTRYNQIQHTVSETCTFTSRGQTVIVCYDKQHPEQSTLKDFPVEYEETYTAKVILALMVPYGGLVFVMIMAVFVLVFTTH